MVTTTISQKLDITPTKTNLEKPKLKELKIGDKFNVGKDGYVEITLGKQYNGTLEFLISFYRGTDKEGKKIWDKHGSEVLTKEGKQHKLNLDDGSKVEFKIKEIKGNKYVIEISDTSKSKK